MQRSIPSVRSALRFRPALLIDTALLIAAPLLIGADNVAADPPPTYEALVLAEYDEGASDSRILSTGCGEFHVAWVAPDDVVWTRSYANQTLGPLVSHGAGRDPVLSGANGVWLAWATGPDITVQEESHGWLVSTTLVSGYPENAHHPDFGYWSNETGPAIAWVQGSRVLFSHRQGDGSWSTPEVAVTGVSEESSISGLQLETDEDLLPRVYCFLGAEFQPAWSERLETGTWTDPTVWPETHWDFAWPFRVAARGGLHGPHSALRVGLYRTCPCNEIYFTREMTSGVWEESERLTVDGATFNWPQYCGLAGSPDGSMHCFWYQSFYDAEMQPIGQEMFYRVRSFDGTWQTPWEFDSHVGQDTDVSVGNCLDGWSEPEFCWIESDDDGSRVVALHYVGAGVGTPAPIIPPLVSVRPNPAAGAVEILWSDAARPARAWIVDAGGRLIRQFPGAALLSDHILWDGRAASGEPVPSGSYWIRIVSADGVHDTRVVRLR